MARETDGIEPKRLSETARRRREARARFERVAPDMSDLLPGYDREAHFEAFFKLEESARLVHARAMTDPSLARLDVRIYEVVDLMRRKWV